MYMNNIAEEKPHKDDLSYNHHTKYLAGQLVEISVPLHITPITCTTMTTSLMQPIAQFRLTKPP